MLISVTDCPSTYVYIRFVSERLPCSCPVVLFLVGFTYAGYWESATAVL